MTIVSLEEVKNHLRIVHDEQDVVLAIYIGAADDFISNFLNQDIVPKKDSIKSAALLIVGDLYENREASTDGNIKPNPAVQNLLYPFRVDIGF